MEDRQMIDPPSKLTIAVILFLGMPVMLALVALLSGYWPKRLEDVTMKVRRRVFFYVMVLCAVVLAALWRLFTS